MFDQTLHSKQTTHKGKLIVKQAHFRSTWTVFGLRRWGDEVGEDRYHFNTLKAAKAFIDRMDARGEL